MKMWPLVLALATCNALAEPPSASVHLPAVQGETFSGVPLSLPQANYGRPVILVIGFTQGSRDAVALWGKWLFDNKDLAADYYEMPVLASVPKLLRGLVTGKIKASIPEPARPHFIPLLDHEGEWRKAAEYEATDDAYILLADGQWMLRWHTHGPPTEQALAELRKALTAAQRR